MKTFLPTAIRASLATLAAGRSILDPSTDGSAMERKLVRVLEVFRETGVRWALVGAHAIGTFTHPRATEDFDFVIEDARLRGVLDALEKELGELDPIDMGPAIRLRAHDLDLIRSATHPLFQAALDRVRTVGDWRIPVPEVLLALKFLAAVSPWRDRTKKMQDTVDLRALYMAVGKDALDAELLRELAAKVYPGAEKEFSELLARLESGEPSAI